MGESASKRTTGERLAVVEEKIDRALLLLEESGSNGVVKRMYEAERQISLFTAEFRKWQEENKANTDKLLKQIDATNERINCHLEEEKEQLKDLQEKRGTRIEKIFFQSLNVVNSIVVAYLLTKLGLK